MKIMFHECIKNSGVVPIRVGCHLMRLKRKVRMSFMATVTGDAFFEKWFICPVVKLAAAFFSGMKC